MSKKSILGCYPVRLFEKTKPISAVTAISAVNEISVKNVQEMHKNPQKLTKILANRCRSVSKIEEHPASSSLCEKTNPISVSPQSTPRAQSKKKYDHLGDLRDPAGN